jgi:hypothetical protein
LFKYKIYSNKKFIQIEISKKLKNIQISKLFRFLFVQILKCLKKHHTPIELENQHKPKKKTLESKSHEKRKKRTGVPYNLLMCHDPITTPCGRDHIAHSHARKIWFAWQQLLSY